MQDTPKVHRAGMIPYIIEDGEIKMMFMKPALEVAEWSTDTFQIAKGKIENGETAMAAAIREAHEELGLFRGNVILTEEVGVFMGRTTVFVSKVKDKDMFGLPSDETSDTCWMTETEFLDQGRSLHQPVVQAAMRQINKIENVSIQPRGLPLYEVFERPETIQYKSIGDEEQQGFFTVDGHKYVAYVQFRHVEMNNQPINFGNVGFAYVDSDNQFHHDPQEWRSNPFKVIGGVVAVVDYIIKNNSDIKVMIFGADNNHGDVSKRMKLYNSVADTFVKQFGTVAKNIPTLNGQCTVLTRSDAPPGMFGTVKAYVEKRSFDKQ